MSDPYQDYLNPKPNMDLTSYLELKIFSKDLRIATLEGFARDLLKLSDFRNDIDGGDFQDLAIQYGILKGVEVTEPCGPICNCAEFFGLDDFPQTCYRSTLPEAMKDG